MKVLVTGATGFTGRALAETLAAEGQEVRLIVRDRARWRPGREWPGAMGEIGFRIQDRISARRISEALREDRNRGIRLGDNVWIGTHSVVLDGVSVGEGAAVAAGAVVAKEVPAWSIAARVPAAVVKQRALGHGTGGEPPDDPAP